MTTESIGALKQALAQYLQGVPALKQAKLLTEYPAAEREYPLKAPVVAVGLDAMEVLPGGLGGYWGEQQDLTAVYGRALELTIRFDFLCAPKQGGAACHELWEAVCTALALEQCPFAFQKLWCGQLEFDKTLSANRLTARASLRALLARSDSVLPIGSFKVEKI